MRHRQAAAATLCLAVAAAGAGLGSSAVDAAETRAPTNALASPNVIMIMADDLGYDQISLNGGPIATPNIDRIAEQGVRFTDGYVVSPVCSPSRHAVLTGRHPSRKGNHSNWLSRSRPERLPSPTVANVLKDRGYTTKAVGKWDVAGFSGRWGDNNVTLPHDAGFDQFYGTLRGIEDYCAGDGTIWRYTGDGYNGVYPGDYPSAANTRYMTHEYTSNAEQFVLNHRDDVNPFFLYLSYTAPHAPLQTPQTCPNQDESASTYRSMVEIMDNGVGRVLDALGSAAENTMVVFVSDHGSQFPQFFPSRLRAGKYTLFEGGVRAPFAMSWPAGLNAASATYSEMVSTLDLLPTIAAAAGAGVSGYPGKDLIPYLNGSQAGSPHQRLHWRSVYDDQTSDQGTVNVAVRSGDYKYLRSTDAASGATQEHLYDLASDAGESNNLAGDPGYAAVKDRLIAEHNTWNADNQTLEGFQNPRPNNQPRAGKPDGFVTYGGAWNVVDADGGKEYRGVADGLAGRVMLPGVHYADVDASVQVRLAERGQAGLIVRGSSAATSPYGLTGYVVRLISPPDTATPERVVLNRVVNGDSVEVRSLNRAVDPGVTYRLGVRVVGDTVSVSVDGATQFNWTDSAPIAGGGLGLRVVGATAYFDSLNANQIDTNQPGPMPLADPDTIQLPGPDQRYVTYGTSRDGREVPYVIHGSGNTVGMDSTIDGDAMPGGPGSWARDDIGLWAPSAVRYNGTFYLFYTATLNGTGSPGRKCIGVAVSTHALGPFQPRANPLLCNAGGWSIDPDAFIGTFNGNLYVTYRDDGVVPRPETAISVVRLNDTATEVLSKRVLFTSTQITWETVGISDGQGHVIENPSMVRVDGRWWLFYSGNRWQTAKYATGIAACGESPTAASCVPHPGPHRPWFGYDGPDGLQDPHRPMQTLPGNDRGPGGMSVFHARDGSMRVVWHYLSDGDTVRFSRTGVLNFAGDTDFWTVTPEQ